MLTVPLLALWLAFSFIVFDAKSRGIVIGLLVALGLLAVGSYVVWRTVSGRYLSFRHWAWKWSWVGAVVCVVSLMVVLSLGDLPDSVLGILVECFSAGVVLLVPLLHCAFVVRSNNVTHAQPYAT